MTERGPQLPVSTVTFIKFVVLVVAILALVVLLLLMLQGGLRGAAPQPPDTPTPVPSTTPTEAPEVAVIPSDTPAATATEAPTRTPRPSDTPPPTETSEPSNTPRPTLTHTARPTEVAEVTAVLTDTPVATPMVPSPTPTSTPSSVPSTPTVTPSAVPPTDVGEPPGAGGLQITSPTAGASVPPGRLVISGVAAPGTRVRVTDGGETIGTARSNTSGGWTITLGQGLESGTHMVVAEALDASGATADTSNPVSFTVLQTVTPTTGGEGLPWQVVLLVAGAMLALALVFMLAGAALRAWERTRRY